jgi:RNA polymerase sigma factor (sigma-70 family)
MTEQIDLKRRPAGGKCDGAAVTDHPRKRDADLVVRLIDGGADAWQEFIDNFSSAIFGAVINTLRKSGYGSDDSHDITQDVYLRLCKNDFRLLRQFDSTRAGLKTWLGVIASSATIDHLRRKRASTVPIDDLPEEINAVDPEMRDPVRIPDGLLSERQALVLRLLYDKDMDAKEVAALLGIDSQTVRSTHHKALVKLRRYFAAEIE